MSEEEWWQWIYDPLVIEKGGGIVSRISWGENLFKEYIFHTLKSKGFQLVGNPDKIIRKFMWFWRHLAVSDYDKADPIHEPVGKNITRPVKEYFDIFHNCFNSSYFNYLSDEIEASVGGFDDTYLGRRLLAELPYFLWSNIDLTNSPEFIKHEKICAEYDEAMRHLEESEMTIEELDRRRMKKSSGYDPDYVYDKHN
jgi:hypothetical protein